MSLRTAAIGIRRLAWQAPAASRLHSRALATRPSCVQRGLLGPMVSSRSLAASCRLLSGSTVRYGHSGKFVQCLDREIADEGVADPLPAVFDDFVVQTEDGSPHVTMTREENNKTVTVRFSLNDCELTQDETEEGEADGDVYPKPSFIVEIADTTGRVFVADCALDDESLLVGRVALRQAGQDDEDTYFVLTEFLDDELGDSINELLFDYGISEQFGEFLLQFVRQKEHAEYVDFLRNARAFVDV